MSENKCLATPLPPVINAKDYEYRVQTSETMIDVAAICSTGSRLHETFQTSSEAEAAKHIPEWLPPVGETFDQRVELACSAGGLLSRGAISPGFGETKRGSAGLAKRRVPRERRSVHGEL